MKSDRVADMGSPSILRHVCVTNLRGGKIGKVARGLGRQDQGDGDGVSLRDSPSTSRRIMDVECSPSHENSGIFHGGEEKETDEGRERDARGKYLLLRRGKRER